MSREMKTAQVNLRIPPSLKAAAERAAADDQRSFTTLVEKLLTDYLRERGYLDHRATSGSTTAATTHPRRRRSRHLDTGD